MLLLKKEVKKLKMLNSEKMIVSIQNQDLEHANKYFEKALKNDPEEVLFGEYWFFTPSKTSL